MIYTHEQVTGGEEFLGFARQKLVWLERARLEAGTPLMTWGPITIGSAEIFISASDHGNLIRIEAIASGFLFHPRVGPLIAVNPEYPSDRPFMVDAPGFLPDGSVLPGSSYRYPLVDNDHGTRSLSSEDSTWTYETAPTGENYGNIDWIGPAGDVLTWKGPPARLFGLDYHLSIPGLTEYAGSSGAFDYYTPFTGNVYAQGEILDAVPQEGAPRRVLGAALITENKYLIVVASGDYTDVTNPAGGTGGFYDEAWVKGVEGWQRLWYRASSRPTTCWFFNASGTQAVNAVRQIISIDADLICTLSEPPDSGSGIYSQDKSGSTGGDVDDSWAENSYSFDRDGSWPFLSDYKGDTLVTASISVTGTDETFARTENKTLFGTVELWYPGTPEITAIIGPDLAAVGTGYSIEGNVHNVTFTADQGVMTPGGVFTDLSGTCGMITITATACGASASRRVRSPNGMWTLVFHHHVSNYLQYFCESPSYAGTSETAEYRITTWYAAFGALSTGDFIQGCTLQCEPGGWGTSCYTYSNFPPPADSGGYGYAPPVAQCCQGAGFPYKYQPRSQDVLRWVCF